MSTPHQKQAIGQQDRTPEDKLLQMAGDIVAAYVGHNTLPQDKIPDLLTAVYKTLLGLGAGTPPVKPPAPAVPIGKSVTPDYLVCLEDGKKLKMLKRYLRSAHGLSPDDYRAKWGLPADYPMVAPNYAKRRSEFAKQSGLGKGRTKKKT